MTKRRYAELLSPRSLMSLPPGRHADGRGLFLEVSPTGLRRWLVRASVKGGKRRELGLGRLEDVTIADAREQVAKIRRTARRGRYPLVQRRAKAAKAVTFADAFEAYFTLKCRCLSNAKHLRQ